MTVMIPTNGSAPANCAEYSPISMAGGSSGSCPVSRGLTSVNTPGRYGLGPRGQRYFWRSASFNPISEKPHPDSRSGDTPTPARTTRDLYLPTVRRVHYPSPPGPTPPSAVAQPERHHVVERASEAST